MIETVTKTTVTCDRCKKKVERGTYFTIDVYGHDVDPTNMLSLDAALQNVKTNNTKIFGEQKHICPSCIGLINSFIDGTIKLGDC